MLKVTIDSWSKEKLFVENENLYNKLYEMSENSFINKPAYKLTRDENGKLVNKGYGSFSFYVNDLSNIDKALYKYCLFEPVESLEMMGGARINTENVFEAIKRNQIMLPNNLMLDMKELCVEINACTDQINKLIQDGWKLIAILPQHNQARPDYILGKMRNE